ncbi:MAG TPA: response regulator [Actinomycetota bacterium]|nr:response regulator [Actinomycetota bacterium]
MEMLFGADPELELLAPAVADPMEAIELVRAKQPEVVLMDIDLGADIDGIETARRINLRYPQTHIVLMTAMQDEDLLVKAVEAGACGLVAQDAAGRDRPRGGQSRRAR